MTAPREWKILFCLWLLFSVIFFGCSPCNSQDARQGALPVYVSSAGNINNYSLFANSGWDGNWYVGWNTCWIQKLVLPENPGFAKVFLGAKLGRMKIRPAQGESPRVTKALPGSIYIAVSPTPGWKSEDCYFLADTTDIPLEGDPENAVNGTGEARWFWSEIPVSKLKFGGEIFVAVYSGTESLTQAQKSPVLAAAWGDKQTDTWLNDEIKGRPPRDASTALKTGISYFKPAIAVKLVPKNSEVPVVEIAAVRGAEQGGGEVVVAAVTRGLNIEKVWMESSADAVRWQRLGGFVWSAPFQFSISGTDVAAEKMFIRLSAQDELGNIAHSRPAEILSWQQ